MIDPFSLARLPVDVESTVYERRADGKIISARRRLNTYGEEFYVIVLYDVSEDAHKAILERLIALTPREAYRTIAALRKCESAAHSSETKK